MIKCNQWKHGAHFYTQSPPDAVAVFDDEFHAQDTIYLRHGERFLPCRSVSRADITHWRQVLQAWSEKAPIEDHRTAAGHPLPVTIQTATA